MAIFKNTNLEYGGGFVSNRGIITSVGGKLDGTLMQNLNVQFAQQARQLYELGPSGKTARFYYISGRANGTLGVGHVLGPPVELASYYQDFSDVCNAAQNMIDTVLEDSACEESGTVFRGWKAKFCLLIQVQMGVQTPDLLINESSQIMFGAMDYNGQ